MVYFSNMNKNSPPPSIPLAFIPRIQFIAWSIPVVYNCINISAGLMQSYHRSIHSYQPVKCNRLGYAFTGNDWSNVIVNVYTWHLDKKALWILICWTALRFLLALLNWVKDWFLGVLPIFGVKRGWFKVSEVQVE